MLKKSARLALCGSGYWFVLKRSSILSFNTMQQEEQTAKKQSLTSNSHCRFGDAWSLHILCSKLIFPVNLSPQCISTGLIPALFLTPCFIIIFISCTEQIFSPSALQARRGRLGTILMQLMKHSMNPCVSFQTLTQNLRASYPNEHLFAPNQLVRGKDSFLQPVFFALTLQITLYCHPKKSKG